MRFGLSPSDPILCRSPHSSEREEKRDPEGTAWPHGEGATTSATTAILQNSMHVTLLRSACRRALLRMVALQLHAADG
jgi:hypothetical protein